MYRRRYVTAAVSDDAAARMRVGCTGLPLTLLNQSAAAVATSPEGSISLSATSILLGPANNGTPMRWFEKNNFAEVRSTRGKR